MEKFEGKVRKGGINTKPSVPRPPLPASANKSMTVKEFEAKLRDLRARNGWNIEIELTGGIWIFRVFDKETKKLLGETGSTGLEIIIDMLEIPFDKCPWV